MRSKYIHIRQHDEKDCGAACLSMIASYYKLKLPISKYRELIQVDNQGANIYGIVTGAEQIGFTADALEGSLKELEDEMQDNPSLNQPFIARIVNKEGYEHFIVVFNYDIQHDKLVIGDPAKMKISKMTREEFEEYWQEQIITFQPNDDFKAIDESKGILSRFFSYILIQKKMLAIIFVISLIVSGINMFGTVIFQYVLDSATHVSESTMTEEEIAEYNGVEDDHAHEDDKHETGESSFYEKTINKLGVIFSNLNVVCITIIGLYLLKSIIRIFRSHMLAVMTKNINVPLLTNFYNHMMDLPAGFFSTRKSGELISRFQNADEIKNAVSSATLTVMLDSLMAVIFGVVLFFISKTLFFITLITIFIYSLVIFFFKNSIKNINYEIMENDAHLTSYLKETIEGVNTVKTNQYNSVVKNKLKELVNSKEDKCIKGSVIGGIQYAIVEFISSTSIVVLLWTGAYLCTVNAITIGALFTFYYMIDYFLSPVSNLIDLQPQLQTALVAAERLNDILDTKTEKDTGDKEFCNGDICIQNLTFRYGNRNDVLKNISIYVKKGQKIAIIGESGCGKTTLTKLLMRFYEQNQGSITINNVDISEFSFKSYRNHVSYISQDMFLFSDTVRNNLLMGNDNITDEEFYNICKLCRIDDFVQELPMEYDTMLEESGANLSIGQRQRLIIARALLRKPDILIMDEATSNLDSITESCIQNAVNVLDGNMTCIIIAHRLSTIRNCDNIYVMQDGYIEESGTHDELIHLGKLYYNYYSQQASDSDF
ncbi:MAG: peptidase domain-containing ABC transporter [Ruminococcus sp.]|nr:peptidase domain-containing ABC transporter [Ruminococcus sp.]